MRKHSYIGAALVGVIAPVALLATPVSAADDAAVSVLHGIPNLTVDVYVNGDLTLDNFKPGTLAGPLELPADTYSVEITDKDDKQTVLLGPADVSVASGGNYTIVAYLDANGDPTVKAFENDVSTLSAGDARVTVRHTAAAPAVDIEANGDVLVPNLENGEEASADVPADSYDVAIVPAGGGQEVWRSDVDLAEGVNTIAYAWGSLDDGTFDVAVQTIEGLHGSPHSVPAGEVGLASDVTGGNGTQMLLLAVIAGALLAGAAATYRLMKVRG